MSQEFTNTGAAKLTVRKFYLPNGSSTQNKGVVPDISLPSIDDFLPIGEASLPHALMWDEIKPTPFTGKALDQSLVQPLLQASRSRQDSLEEFAYLKKSIDWFKERQEQKTISLNLDKRLALKQADDDFKKVMDAEVERLAKNNYVSREIKLDSVIKADAEAVKPVETALDGGDTDALDAETAKKFDIHLRESLRVIADALHYDGNALVWTNGQAPVTASTDLKKG
jgi:carboxyl-terminal processing protease